MDNQTTIDELRQLAISFREERNWSQFHNSKDLCLGLGIEVGELQELLLWKSEGEVAQYAESAEGRTNLGHELADVCIFILYLSKHFGIDISEAVRGKLALNAIKYPIAKSYGSKKKYNEL